MRYNALGPALAARADRISREHGSALPAVDTAACAPPPCAQSPQREQVECAGSAAGALGVSLPARSTSARSEMTCASAASRRACSWEIPEIRPVHIAGYVGDGSAL